MLYVHTNMQTARNSFAFSSFFFLLLVLGFFARNSQHKERKGFALFKDFFSFCTKMHDSFLLIYFYYNFYLFIYVLRILLCWFLIFMSLFFSWLFCSPACVLQKYRNRILSIHFSSIFFILKTMNIIAA